MTTYPRVLWHASRTRIDRPTLDGRVEGDNHGNSGLGLWCATGPHEYIGGFGNTIHALTLRSDLRVLPLTLPELVKWGPGSEGDRRETRAWFEAEGRRLAHDYDLIELHELNGFSSQAIVLRDEAIADSIAIPGRLFKTISSNVQDHLRAFEEGEAAAYQRCALVRPIQKDLERLDIDDLDRWAFGVIDEETVTLEPEALHIIYPGDLINPMAKFDAKGMNWVRSVDFSEPLEVSVDQNGDYCLEDGHHRWFAAKQLKREIQATITVKGKPIQRIVALHEAHPAHGASLRRKTPFR